MTIKDLKELIKDLPDDYYVGYHIHDKGCGHASYSNGWVYVDTAHRGLLLNPGENYDGRFPNAVKEEIRRKLENNIQVRA